MAGSGLEWEGRGDGDGGRGPCCTRALRGPASPMEDAEMDPWDPSGISQLGYAGLHGQRGVLPFTLNIWGIVKN